MVGAFVGGVVGGLVGGGVAGGIVYRPAIVTFRAAHSTNTCSFSSVQVRHSPSTSTPC